MYVTQGHYVEWQLKCWSVGTGRLENLALMDRAVGLVNPMTGGNTSSVVIDSLYDQAGDENIAVAGLYCDYLEQRRQTVNCVMGSILQQLVGRGEVEEDLRKAFQEARKEFGGREPPLADLRGMLRNAIATIPRVPTCVYALDECLPKYLLELLKSLRDIIRKSPTGGLLGNCALTKLTKRLDDQGNLSPRPSPQQKPCQKIISTDIVRRVRAVVSLLGLFLAVCLGFGNAPGTVHHLEGKFKGGRAREQREGVG